MVFAHQDSTNLQRTMEQHVLDAQSVGVPTHDDNNMTPESGWEKPRVISMPTEVPDQMADEYDHDSDDFAAKYELRPQTRAAHKGFTSTWIDQDDTGDYDPNQERKARIHRAKVKRRERLFCGSTSDSTDEDSSGREQRVRLLPKVMVKLSFKSEASRAGLKACLDKTPARSIPQHDDFTDGYQLRRRVNSSRKLAAQGLESPSGDNDDPVDLTGHPEARGCWECLALRIRCPLLDDEHAWPCYTCLADDHDCELITPPPQKRACERCKQRRITCSYNYTDDHSGPCQDCVMEGQRCAAGPAKDSIRTRIRMDRDWKAFPMPTKKAVKTKTYWTCLHCEESRRECSFTINGPGEDCTACEMGDHICVPKQATVPVQQQTTASRSALPQKKRAPREPAAKRAPAKKARFAEPITRRDSMIDQEDMQGETTKIVTKFCHPVVFNSEIASGGKGCNFCDGSSYAIRGLEQKKVEVIDWEDGRGLTEVHGGHLGEGGESTRVCTTCTMERVSIILCQKHILRPLPKSVTNAMDVNDAIMALFSDTMRKKDRWCSLCPSLAAYECEATGSIDRLGNDCKGCGLELCGTCMLSLAGEYDGDLQKMLGEMEDEPSNERPLGLRADFEFLKQDGLLMRFVLWSSKH